MEVSVLSIPTGLQDWHLVASYLRMRKDIFIERLAWPLQHIDAMEFEQYDRVDAVYVVAHNDRQVYGGARLIRTDRSIGVYSYMIRDAYLRKLPGIPSGICQSEPPQSPEIWELTRFGTNGSTGVGREILTEANAFLSAQNATECLFLGPPAFLRIAKSMGFDPRPMGPVAKNEDGRFLAFSCAVVNDSLK